MNPTPDPIDTRLAGLRTELPPARDLWPGIRAQLGSQQQPEPQRASRSRWAAPAALAACVALAAVLLLRREPAAPAIADASPHAAAVREAAYREARANVESDYDRLLPQLAPQTRQRVEQALGTIRRAEADIAAALAEDPGNPLLLRLRQRAAQREIDLMTTVTRDAVAELPRNET